MTDNVPMVRESIIVGIGVDLVDVIDFSRLLNGPAKNHWHKYFTKHEIAQVSNRVNAMRLLTGMFAVKEAVLKAFGLGWGGGIAFSDVEVVKCERDKPTIVLRRKLLEVERERLIHGWHVSVSHTRLIAVATVIAFRDSHHGLWAS